MSPAPEATGGGVGCLWGREGEGMLPRDSSEGRAAARGCSPLGQEGGEVGTARGGERCPSPGGAMHSTAVLTPKRGGEP